MRLVYSFIFSALSLLLTAQVKSENIVEVIDELTVSWDDSANQLKSYEGLQEYCRNKVFRDNTILLLNQIHHYDSTLYNVVTHKYDTHKDAAAKATLDDIVELEKDYTTKNFLKFLRRECMSFNDNERNKTFEGHDKRAKELEKELARYVKAVTHQIDIVDKHIHHLKDL